jgi:hypothetical protein
MSLNWNLENIQDHKTVCWIETGETFDDGTKKVRMNPVTETLIFMTMAVKLGSITKTNADDFYARLKLIEKLDGPFMTDSEGKARLFTPEDIAAHVGLACNVTSETFAKFLGTFRDQHKSLKRQYLRQTAEAQKVSA